MTERRAPASPRRRAVNLTACGLLAALVGLGAIGSPVRSAAQEPSPDPVLAIVSPIASPACYATGTATLLVPIVGGLIAERAGQEPISVADVVLDSLGPAFVVCAELPEAPGSRCQLDDQIAGFWPQQVGGFISPPGVLGNTADGVAAALVAAGLPPQTALEEALVCSVPEHVVDSTPPPPPAPPAPSLSSSVLGSPTSGVALGAAPLGPGRLTTPALGNPSPGATSTEAPSEGVSPPRVLAAITSRVPGGLVGLQIATALLLAVFLSGSWATSLRLRWAARVRG
jgi:hypothetical protein